ncbi:MAG: PD40 domain-containing protein, partial [Leptospiraceae bacterium]|nr:PD40 domain-containing protein [Leptospiraceae bacterium]
MKQFISLFFLFIFTFVLHSQPLPNPSDTKFGYPLNTQNAEYNPVISPNARYIIFQSNRPGGQGGMDLWLSENTNYRDRSGSAQWAEPVNFRELNTPAYEGAFSVWFNAGGEPEEIYFTSLKDEETGRNGLDGLNIYYTSRNPRTNRWKKPEQVPNINTNFDDKMPAISPDGNTLVFVSNRPGGFGRNDLWVSYRDEKTRTWSTPKNLGQDLNTASNEIMPSFHHDGLSLFFSSDRNDPNYKFDFYTAIRKNVDYKVHMGGKPEIEFKVKKALVFEDVFKLGLPFNSDSDDEGITLSYDGLWVYYSSNRSGGQGQFD